VLAELQLAPREIATAPSWLDVLLSRSDQAAPDPSVRERLFEAIAAAIGAHGGSFLMDFETGLITSTCLG
jgi:hypothetical protein